MKLLIFSLLGFVHWQVADGRRQAEARGGLESFRGENELLATKMENLLKASSQDPRIEKVLGELERQLELNFVKTLSALLISMSPAKAQERREEFFSLMQATLNGRVDFKPIVYRLPEIIRKPQNQQFLEMIRIIHELESKNFLDKRQQSNYWQNLEKMMQLAGKINWQSVGNFMKEIPNMMEGIQSIVETVQDIIP